MAPAFESGLIASNRRIERVKKEIVKLTKKYGKPATPATLRKMQTTLTAIVTATVALDAQCRGVWECVTGAELIMKETRESRIAYKHEWQVLKNEFVLMVSKATSVVAKMRRRIDELNSMVAAIDPTANPVEKPKFLEEITPDEALLTDASEESGDGESEDSEERTPMAATVIRRTAAARTAASQQLAATPANARASLPSARAANTSPPVRLSRRTDPAGDSGRQIDLAMILAKSNKLEIPIFEGEYAEWNRYWALFSELVHKRAAENVVKMTALTNSLAGPALAAIRRFPPSGEKYAEAVAHLRKIYARPERQTQVILDKIDAMKPARSKKPADLRAVHDELVALVAALSELTNTQNPHLYLTVKRKFPEIVWDKLETSEELFDKDDVEQLLNTIGQVIYRLEEKAFERSEYRADREADSIVLTTAHATSAPSRGDSCRYCSMSNHTSGDCKKYRTPEDRKKRVNELKLCYNCLSDSHKAKQCKSGKCKTCQRSHHSSLCSGSDKKLNKYSEGEAKNKKKGLWKRFSVNHVSSSAGRLMVVQAKVLSQTGKAVSIDVLLDSGAKRSFIDGDLADELGLQSLNETMLHLQVFGGGAVKEKSSLRPTTFLLPSGDKIECMLYTKKGITNPVRRSQLNKKDLNQLKKLGLEKLTQEMRQPSILLGADVFWHVVDPASRVSLPSGAMVISTVFGLMVVGKSESSAVNFVMASVNTVRTNTVDGNNVQRKHEDSVESYNHVVKHVKKFWREFTREYMANNVTYTETALKRASKSATKRPRVGDMVLIRDENKSRREWPTALVTGLKEGRDGQVRTVHVRTANGHVLSRAIQHLVPIEIERPEPKLKQKRTPTRFNKTATLVTMMSLLALFPPCNAIRDYNAEVRKWETTQPPRQSLPLPVSTRAFTTTTVPPFTPTAHTPRLASRPKTTAMSPATTLASPPRFPPTTNPPVPVSNSTFDDWMDGDLRSQRAFMAGLMRGQQIYERSMREDEVHWRDSNRVADLPDSHTDFIESHDAWETDESHVIPSGNDTVIVCTETGVTLYDKNPAGTYDVCSEHYCLHGLQSGNATEVVIPVSILTVEHAVKWRQTEESRIQIIATVCPPKDYCKTAACATCITHVIINPHCSVRLFVIYISAIIGFMVTAVYCCVCCPHREWREKRRENNQINALTGRGGASFGRRVLGSMRRNPDRAAEIEMGEWLTRTRTPANRALLIATVFAIMSVASACDVSVPISHSEEQCSWNKCTIKKTVELMFTPTVREICLHVGGERSETEKLSFKLEYLSHKCVPGAIMYTKNVSPHNASVKRCADNFL